MGIGIGEIITTLATILVIAVLFRYLMVLGRPRAEREPNRRPPKQRQEERKS